MLAALFTVTSSHRTNLGAGDVTAANDVFSLSAVLTFAAIGHGPLLNALCAGASCLARFTFVAQVNGSAWGVPGGLLPDRGRRILGRGPADGVQRGRVAVHPASDQFGRIGPDGRGRVA